MPDFLLPGQRNTKLNETFIQQRLTLFHTAYGSQSPVAFYARRQIARIKARDMRARLRRRRLLGLGFGAATAGLAMVPVVNFIVMPSAVAGATAMWVRELKSE